jgi:hypothetical protein
MRPSLAGDLTRSLLDVEGLPPESIIVVVNGVGGLDDPGLEAKVKMVRLPENLGPAGGFKVGITEAFSNLETTWAYLCEDDIGLLPLPRPRLSGLMARIAAYGGHQPVGAVVAFGRSFIGRGSHTVNDVPPATTPNALAPTHVGSWGATVMSRRVFELGILPDTDWYFGLEDFDWYCRIREAGLEVLVDVEAAEKVAAQQTTEGRRGVLAERRPTDGDEAWRAYYHARNSFALARRHGDPTWHFWHVAYSARKLQQARSNDERVAIVHGLWDGMLGRMGEHPNYHRQVGELPWSRGPGVDDTASAK